MLLTDGADEGWAAQKRTAAYDCFCADFGQRVGGLRDHSDAARSLLHPPCRLPGRSMLTTYDECPAGKNRTASGPEYLPIDTMRSFSSIPKWKFPLGICSQVMPTFKPDGKTHDKGAPRVSSPAAWTLGLKSAEAHFAETPGDSSVQTLTSTPSSDALAVIRVPFLIPAG